MSQVDYGAVASKVRAMYGGHLKREDFQRLADMRQLSEVASQLKTYPAYAGILAALGPQISERRLLEEALNDDLTEEYLRILSFTARRDADIMRSHIIKSELREIMRFMQLAETGRAAEFTSALPKIFYRHSKIRYNTLSNAVTYSDMLDAVKETSYHAVLQQLELRPSGFPDYTSVETAVRSAYYRGLFTVINRSYSGAAGENLRMIIGTQADMINITAILRLKRYFPKAIEGGGVYKYLIPSNYKLKPELIKLLLNAKDEAAMLAVLRSSSLSKLFPLKQTHSDLDRYYYDAMLPVYRRLLRNGSPDVSTPLAYLFLKELEIKNLKSLIECVRYNIPVEKTMSYLIL